MVRVPSVRLRGESLLAWDAYIFGATHPWQAAVAFGAFAVLSVVVYLFAARESSAGGPLQQSSSPPVSRLKELYDAVQAGVIVRRADGRVTHVNKTACEMFGRTQEELMVRLEGDDLHVITEDGRKVSSENWPTRQTLRSGECMHGQTLGVVTASGQVRWLLLNTSFVSSTGPGQRPDVVATFVDITAQKQAESDLRESESRLENTLRAAPVGFGILQGRRFTWVNDEMLRMLGYEESELVGQSIRKLYESDQEYHRVGEIVYATIEETGIGLTETRYVRRDGSVFDSHVQVAGTVGEVVVAIVDISGRKDTERALRKAVGSLRRKNIALEELTAQVRQERRAMVDRISLDVDRLLLPLVTRLERSLTGKEREYMRAFVDDLHDVLAPFGPGASSALSKLTPSEMRIATLIRRGMSGKEIAQAEGLSVATVNTHRANIRKKLHLRGRAVNLTTHLRELFEKSRNREPSAFGSAAIPDV